MAYLQLQGIEKFFGDHRAIKGIDLNINQGEFVVFVGPSGCGKSTLLRLIAGLEQADAGEIHIGGINVEPAEPPADALRVAASRDLPPRMRERVWRGSTLTHREWVEFDQQRAVLRAQWRAYFETVDLLITPVATSPAFVHQQQGERWDRMLKVNGQDQPHTDSLFWAGYPGVVGLPATAVPLAYATLSRRKRAMARIGQTRSGLIEDALIVAAGRVSIRSSGASATGKVLAMSKTIRTFGPYSSQRPTSSRLACWSTAWR